MSGERSYASVPERITWTTGFHNGTDKIVLGALSAFANFETGKGARVSIKKLCARAERPRRTVLRSLQRLEADGWILVTRHHRHATARDIAIDRLAPHWIVAKNVGGVNVSFPQGDTNLSVKNGTQLGARNGTQLSVKNGTQIADLSAKNDTQIADLSAKNGTPIPCTEDLTPVEPIPSAPALRAGLFDTDDENREEAHASQPATPVADVRADRGDRADDSDVSGRGLPQPTRRDQAPAPGVGVSLSGRTDLPRAPSDRPRPPQQQTFGPIDVSPSPARPAPQWGQLAEALRQGLKRQSG